MGPDVNKESPEPRNGARMRHSEPTPTEEPRTSKPEDRATRCELGVLGMLWPKCRTLLFYYTHKYFALEEALYV